MSRTKLDSRITLAFVAIAVACLTCGARAANVWTGTGDWGTPGNWDQGYVPTNGEDVVIQSGVVTITTGTAALGSYRLQSGATNVFDAWSVGLTAATVTVEGVMTHPTNSDTSATGGWVPDKRVYVVCTDFILTGSGVIDLDESGWTSPWADGGYGPGGAPAGWDGGGYGGMGGDATLVGAGGPTYGSAAMPVNPGSGGSGRAGTGPGGYGGGAVRVAATGHVLVNGTITADGGPGLGSNYRGGGSGGGVYITCNTFAATNGLIEAKGGDVTAGTTGCGGGGGRIAVVFTNTVAQDALPVPTLQTSVIGGNKTSFSRDTGRHGTVHFGSCRLELASSPGGSTDIAAGWYTNGAQVTITPVDGANHTFLQWSGRGVPAGSWTNNPLTVTMDRTRTIQANFVTNAAVTRAWSGTGNWYSPANWTPQGIPGTGDTCNVHSGSVTLSDPAMVGALSVSNATLTFTNWQTTLTARDVAVLNNGTIGIAAAFFDRPMHLYAVDSLPTTNRISIVCTNLLVADGGVIDANEKGYRGQGAVPNHLNHGPGRRIGGVWPHRGAASHGGKGSFHNHPTYAPQGPTYGNVAAPLQPGTGGTVGAGGAVAKSGGGAIRIQADSVVVNGTIRADGGGGGGYVGGASGGSVFITCNTFQGTNGIVSADGADHGSTGAPGGGGGRIAVAYDTTAQSALAAPRVKLSVKGGLGLSNGADNGYSWSTSQYPGLGSLYFPDAQFIVASGGPELIGELVFAAGVTNWSGASLTLSNGWMRLPTGFVMTVTGDVTVNGTTRLGLPNGVLDVGSDLVVADSSDFYLYGGETNGTADNGMLVNVAGGITVHSNGTLRPFSEEFNGGSVLFRTAVLDVRAGGRIDADSAGFRGWYGPGQGDFNVKSAGGYGGKGGRANAGHSGGETYGWTNAPMDPGSGGGSYEGEEGGGLVRVEATGTVTVDGTITAGGGGGDVRSGCGSGGGVYIRCTRIEGSGALLADGGDNTRAGYSAGGGGRIAVWRLTDGFSHANASAAGGAAASGGTYDGEDGTVVWSNMPAAGPWVVGALPASSITTNSVRMNGEIVTPGGGENPAIYFCWHLTDQGTSATGNWPHADYVGTNFGVGQSFSNEVTDLLMGSNYTYRVYVTNSSGTNWSAPEVFRTLGWPSVTNLGAVARPRGALLRAEVTDGGANTPYAWFSYWLDGSAATTTVAKGLQGGVFSSEVGGLQSGGNYSYLAMVSNTVGAVWSDVKGFVPLGAVTNTWSGNGQNWNDPAQWSGGDVPVPGEDVVINGNVVLTNTTPDLYSYTINTGATNTFYGWTTAIAATLVRVDGALTHTINTDVSAAGGWVPDQRVYVVCTDFVLGSNGVIDVDEKGWTSPSANGGYGPGGAPSGGDGGGYGGVGGDYTHAGAGGPTYGSASMPTSPGSGGSGHTSYGPGGFGGGAVRIEADGRVTLNGTITANGGPGLGANYRGAGSGGGVYVTCATFAAVDGLIEARGGDVIAGTTGSGGGGGRVAVVFTNTAAQNALPVPDVQVSVIGGNKPSAGAETGRHGTDYFGSYRLDLGSSPGGSTDVSAGWHTNGAPVTITPLSGANHTFLQWSGTGVPQGHWSDNPLTVTMDQTRAIQANFESNTPTVRAWSGTGNWFSYTNWSPEGVPGSGDACLVHSGDLSLSDPVTVSSLSVSNASISFSDWTTTLTATDVGVLDGGVITIAGAFHDRVMHLYPVDRLPMTNRISIVCTNLFVAGGGSIDADQKGYKGALDVPQHYAHGPGRVVAGSQPGRRGVSHGGEGSYQRGARPVPYTPGPTYGSPASPTTPGTGGQTVSGGTKAKAGGGAIRIVARSVVVNGTVGADGGGGGGYVGGASGGAIFITCRTFQGTNGVVSADGADHGGVAAPGGGGGRIAVVYDPPAQSALPSPRVRLSVKGGAGLHNNADNFLAWGDADMGTLYLPDDQFITSTFVPDLTGEIHFGDGTTSWAGNGLVLGDGWLRMPNGFVFDVSGHVTITGVASVAKLDLPNGELKCGGDLTVADGNAFHVFAGPTNSVAAEYGALVDVGGDIILGANATLSPHAEAFDGGSVLFRARDVTVPATAAIDADAAGYYGNAGPGRSSDAYDGGGGYGGAGGRANVAHPLGASYGVETQPAAPGSGGGGYDADSGGGLVWIDASGTLMIDGTVTAAGGGGYSLNAGTGSGGGVYLRCNRIAGSGTLMAEGGDNARAGDCAGGGGRIAVWRSRDAFNHANASAAGGTAASGGTYDGEDGTVYWGDIPPSGTVFVVR